MTKATTPSEPKSSPTSVLPGVALTAVAVAVSIAVASVVPVVSALTAAVALGICAGNMPWLPDSVRPGLAWSTRRLLRVGVILLGLQLAVGEVLGLGGGVLLTVVAVVVVTFVATVWIGRLLGVSRGLSVLIGTGFSICGASAIAAMESVVDREDEDVATAVAMVTIFGTVTMVALPVFGSGLGLSELDQGRLAGAAVHEVAQVVAAASPAGAAAVAAAVVVKLSRVVLLAPMVAVVSLAQRKQQQEATGKRPPIVPLFVVGFLVAVVVRSTGVLPEVVLSGAEQVTTVLLAGALFALGSAVRVRSLMRNGPKAFALGACSTVVALVVAAAGILLMS